MKNSYIPEVLKEKILKTINIFYGLALLLLSVLSAIALLTFNINDNSFLTSTSNVSQNLLGNLGSYYASFLFYTFGILAYLVILFFLIYSIYVFVNKNPRYLFIRLLLFFISLIFIPQIFIDLKLEFTFIDSIKTWGIFADQLFNLYNYNYISYLLTFIGISIYMISQNFLDLFKISKPKLNNIFKRDNRNSISGNKIKKEPIINNISSNNYTQDEINENIDEVPLNQKTKD